MSRKAKEFITEQQVITVLQTGVKNSLKGYSMGSLPQTTESS
jgi:hypothetical protein